MIIIVMGGGQSERNSLGRLLAITLDWEFADAEELSPTYVAGVADQVLSAKSTRMQTLSAALGYWVYNWHDVVVSCWTLTEQERKLFSGKQFSVKFIYLSSPDASLHPEKCLELSTVGKASRSNPTEPSDEVLRVDPSRRTKEIIAEVVTVLVLNRRSQDVLAS
jgi:hypothetical protein